MNIEQACLPQAGINDSRFYAEGIPLGEVESKMNKYDLEERLIEFSVLIIEIVNETPNSKSGNHLSGQLVRSGTSVSLNYGEAQSGESRKDFIYPVR
ncbi:MAG: four helix bundle protein [Candidatus Marinimicrobia bacterium]|nr:four helix bundle protein [Candidatus Neomarinimicrobiota bacterium]